MKCFMAIKIKKAKEMLRNITNCRHDCSQMILLANFASSLELVFLNYK